MLALAFEKIHREGIQLSADKRGFVGEKTGQHFTPVGFNYDHDEHFRLLEDYWHEEWHKVVVDMTAMKQLGATVIRIHLQLGKFLSAPDQLNMLEFRQLDRLVKLAKSLGLYLDLVGLACYHSWEVPAWYDSLEREQRWQAQAFFWNNMAKRYARESAIFCFDLMNEPVVPGKNRFEKGWLGKDYFGKNYIQFISLEGSAQTRSDIALSWLRCMKQAIREYDKTRLITVGLVDWSLPSSKMKSGFFPEKIVHELDFICAHLYPEQNKIEEMIRVLRGFCVGKPVLIDETFQLRCDVPQQKLFLAEAAKYAQGFITFYTDGLPEIIDNGRNQMRAEVMDIFFHCVPLFGRRKLDK